MATGTINVGILGAGNISDTHARAAREIPGVEVVAVHGQNLTKAARLAELYGGRAYDRLEEFLDHRPMDLVAIGSPSGLHAEQGITAAARGLHVLVEKPIDINTKRADTLIAAADRAGVKLGVFFQDRLKPDVVRMKAMVAAGALGTPIVASGRVKWYRPPDYYSASRWRGTNAFDGGGALINQAIHTLDVLLHLMGPIARVDARVATRLHRIEVEDTAVAMLEFENGALGVFEASTAVFPGYARRVEITGSNGTLVLDHDQLVTVDLKEPRGGLGADAATATPAAAPANAASPTVADATPHRRVLEDFIRAIRTSTTPACDGREGRRSVAVVEAIYASARTGQSVAVGQPQARAATP
jgi:UDP-N-acetyl-2-amino-2-deoxyglucuronate dehydrogenase